MTPMVWNLKSVCIVLIKFGLDYNVTVTMIVRSSICDGTSTFNVLHVIKAWQ